MTETIKVRGGARYHVQVTNRDFEGTISAEREEQRHELGLYVGASAFGFVDAAVRIPYVWEDIDTDFSVGNDTDTFNRGWADLELAGKVTLELGPFAVAPYLLGRIETGEPEVEDLMEAEYGVAGTFSLFNEYLSVHANLAGLQRETGITALRYRVGGAFVVWADHTAVVRAYGYADGVEWEGKANTDVNVDLGVQARFLDFISVELGATVRVLEADRIDDDLADELEARGVVADHFDDEGTFGVHLGVGVVW